MQAHDMPFTKLINVDQGAREHFHVPKYQREYTWRKWQWEQLLNDIEDNAPGYFMGSIICVHDSEAISVGDEIIFEVVDGQQRLTTLSLLLMAIHSNLSAAKANYEAADEQDEDEIRTCLTNLRAKLVKRKKDPKKNEAGGFTVGKNTFFLRVQPSAQNHNLADYRYLLCEAGLVENQPKQPYCGNRLLAKAYSFFSEKVPKDVPGLLSLMEKINQLVFVQITVSSQADAFTLFESLNNRGVPLSAIDIIKNKMLAQMEKKHAVDIDESFERWQGLIASVPEADDQERFLRHFYNVYKHRDAIRVDKAPRATRSQIIRIYETLINRNALTLFEDLTKSAATYGKLLRCEASPKQLATALQELERIGSTPGYQILLYLLSLEAKNFEDAKFLTRVVEFLCRFFIRRNVTDLPPTREMDQIFIDIVELCAKRVGGGDTLGYDWFTSEFMKRAQPASLEKFTSALSDHIYENNTWMARYLLIQIDQLHHSREYQPDFWARDDKGRFVWTVEHVLPQAERLPDHWTKMIADGDKEAAATVQDQWVHRFGNLTLSGYNSDLATAAFEKKQKLSKDRSFLGHKINIGYQNGLFLNGLTFTVEEGKVSLANASHWNAATIESRTKVMVEMIAKANRLPGE